MKYFAEYVPVKGEIKEGDLVFDLQESKYMIKATDPSSRARYKEVETGAVRIRPDNWMQKRILFLCSRDIEVGDTFNEGTSVLDCICTSRDKQGIYSEGKWEEDFHRSFNCYKVIGEISPAATWVKQGMEFEEHQVKSWFVDTQNNKVKLVEQGDINRPGTNWKLYEVSCQIKCPTCGTFH